MTCCTTHLGIFHEDLKHLRQQREHAFKCANENYLQRMPAEILHYVGSYLPLPDLAALGITCHSIYLGLDRCPGLFLPLLIDSMTIVVQYPS